MLPPPPDPTRVVGRRCIAAMIDLGLGWVVAIIATKVTEPSRSELLRRGSEALDAAAINSLQILLFYVFAVFVVIRGVRGRTPGLWSVKLTLVNENGVPPGLTRSTVRLVFGLLDWIGIFVPGVVGLISMLRSRGHRRIGDMVAGTYVIDDGAVGRPVLVPSTRVQTPNERAVLSLLVAILVVFILAVLGILMITFLGRSASNKFSAIPGLVGGIMSLCADTAR